MDEEVKAFLIRVDKWLKPKGFQEVYKCNHPGPSRAEVHYVKDGIRICCFKQPMEEFFTVLSDISGNRDMGIHPMTLHTGRYEIGSEDMDFLFHQIKQFRNLIKQSI